MLFYLELLAGEAGHGALEEAKGVQDSGGSGVARAALQQTDAIVAHGGGQGVQRELNC